MVEEKDNNQIELCNVELFPKPQRDDEIPKKSKSSPTCCKNTFYYFQSFSDNASIDGLKFLGEEDRSLIEILFWSIVIIIALIFSVILVFQTYIKWINSPIIVTFGTIQKPIYEIPFPAITICPEVKSSKDIANYTDIYLKMDDGKNITPYESFQFDTLSLICDPEENKRNNSNLFSDESALDFLAEVAPSLDEIFFDVEWKGKKLLDYNQAFTPVFTEEGVCYTFNSLDKSEIFTDSVKYPDGFFVSSEKESQWSTGTGYSPNADINAYPKRTFLAGAEGGLKLKFIGRMSDLDYVCGDALQGFKIALHHPAEIPKVKQHYFRLPINQAIVVGLKPKIMTTAKDLEEYAPVDRQCYYESEKKLKFFKIYNQRNCMVECLTNFTLKSCECVDFYMPRENSTKICGIAQKYCTERAKVYFLTGDVNRKITKYSFSRTSNQGAVQNLSDFKVNFDDQCDCLPSCHSIDFIVETSQSDWNWKEVIKVYEQTHKHGLEGELLKVFDIYLSTIMIYFKDMQFVTSERNELYGYTDFWANIGGVIGLFTGFSFITIFEILYYLSLRLTCNIKMFGKKFWSGSPKVLDDAYTSDDE